LEKYLLISIYLYNQINQLNKPIISINQSTNQPINQPINQSTNQP